MRRQIRGLAMREAVVAVDVGTGSALRGMLDKVRGRDV